MRELLVQIATTHKTLFPASNLNVNHQLLNPLLLSLLSLLSHTHFIHFSVSVTAHIQ
jgi:hypothetical protein